MGCGCHKKTKPMGGDTPPPPTPPPAEQSAAVGKTQTFSLGAQTFGSRLEAEAAKKRGHLTGEIRSI